MDSAGFNNRNMIQVLNWSKDGAFRLYAVNFKTFNAPTQMQYLFAQFTASVNVQIGIDLKTFNSPD